MNPLQGTHPQGAMSVPHMPGWVLADLRTDHAGEVGAVCIYRGVLRFAKDPALRAFADHHRGTDQPPPSPNHARRPTTEHHRMPPSMQMARSCSGGGAGGFGGGGGKAFKK